MLLFLIMSIGANNYTNGINPMLVGLIILLIGLGIGSTTGYAINPARDLAPRIMHLFYPLKEKVIPIGSTPGFRYRPHFRWLPREP